MAEWNTRLINNKVIFAGLPASWELWIQINDNCDILGVAVAQGIKRVIL